VTGVANGTANYTYTLQDISGATIAIVGPTAAITANFPNVVPGTYTVVTTDASGCEDRDVVTISQNQLDLVPVSPPPATDCNTTFTYIVNIVGGTPPYLIGLVGDPLVFPNVDADTHDFTGQVGYGTTYFVEVVDALGCRYIEQIDPIDPPSPITVTASATTASCAPGGNGVISYTVDGIVPSPADFTVQLQNTDTGALVGAGMIFINEPMPFSGTIPGLPPGNYQVLVNDDDTQCDGSALVSITTNIPSLVVDNNEPATCNVGALVTVRGNGGTPAYGFAFVPAGDPAPVTFTAQTTYGIPGPYPANYDFYVEDSNGCTSFTTVMVTQAAGVPTPTVDVINQCTAVANYTINVTSPLTSGPAPETTFEYDIGGGFQTGPNFTVPNPGDYTIVVRDGNGCTNMVVARVFDFFAISASATTEPTCNAGDGVITINTSGGSGNFRYELDDGVNPTVVQINDPVFISLSPGSYTILVTDLDSNTVPLCSDTASVEVTVVNTPVISATPKGDITCNGADDGYITVELQPGTDTDTPLTFTLYDGGTATVVRPAQPTAIFDDLPPGTYQVEVTSNRGCTDRSGDVVIVEPTPLQIGTANTEFTCDPSSNRFNTATITVYTDTNGDGTGTPTGTAPYTYT
jgi:hypothetical protein